MASPKRLGGYAWGTISGDVTRRLVSGADEIQLELRPSLHFRLHENDVAGALQDDYQLTVRGRHYEISAGNVFPPLRLAIIGERGAFTHDGGSTRELAYSVEATIHRGVFGARAISA